MDKNIELLKILGRREPIVWNLLARAVPALSRAEEYPALLGALKKIWVTREEITAQGPGHEDTYIFSRLAGQFHSSFGCGAGGGEECAIIFSRKTVSPDLEPRIYSVRLKYNYGRLHGDNAVLILGDFQSGCISYFRGQLTKNKSAAVNLSSIDETRQSADMIITANTNAGGWADRMRVKYGSVYQIILYNQNKQFISQCWGWEDGLNPALMLNLSDHLTELAVKASKQDPGSVYMMTNLADSLSKAVWPGRLN